MTTAALLQSFFAVRRVKMVFWSDVVCRVSIGILPPKVVRAICYFATCRWAIAHIEELADYVSDKVFGRAWKHLCNCFLWCGRTFMLVNSCILGILASSGVFNENTAVFSTKSTKTRNRYSNNLQQRRQKSATAQTFAHGCLLKQKNNEPYTDKTSA